MKEKVYILGPMLDKGSQIVRKMEAEAFRELGYEVYSAAEQKDINDKQNQTVESNNTLAERIYAKDMDAIRHASLIIAEVGDNYVGSSVEIGAIAEFNWMRSKIVEALGKDRPIEEIKEFLIEYPEKEVWCHTTDIRHTTIPEIGARRSIGLNQFLHGACLWLNRIGIITFDKIINVFKKRSKK